MMNKWKIYRINYMADMIDYETCVFAVNRGSAEVFILEDLHPTAEIKFIRAEVASTNRPNVFRRLVEYNKTYNTSMIKRVYDIEPALEW